jgi:hypothetical protein
MRRLLRWAVLAVVVVCLVAFFSVETGASSSGTGAVGRQVSWFSIGQPWPWYENRMEQELRPDGGHAFSGQAGVIRNSPAWLVLGSAVVGLAAFRLLRPLAPRPALA